MIHRAGSQQGATREQLTVNQQESSPQEQVVAGPYIARMVGEDQEGERPESAKGTARAIRSERSVRNMIQVGVAWESKGGGGVIRQRVMSET